MRVFNKNTFQSLEIVPKNVFGVQKVCKWRIFDSHKIATIGGGESLSTKAL